MSNGKKYSAQVGRVLRIIEVLAGHEFDPLSTGTIAKAVGIAAPVATRDLQAAAHFGWIEKTQDGKWRCKRAKFTCMAIAIQTGIQRARTRLEDEANQYTRSPY